MKYQLNINNKNITLVHKKNEKIVINNISKLDNSIKNSITSLVLKNIGNSTINRVGIPINFLSNLGSLNKIEFINIKTEAIISTLYSLKNINSISIDNCSITDAKAKAYRLNSNYLKQIINKINNFTVFKSIDIKSNISATCILKLKGILDYFHNTTKIENYNIRLILPGEKTVLKELICSHKNNSIKIIDHYKSNNNKFNNFTKKRSLNKLKDTDNEEPKKKKIKMTPLDIIDLTDTEAKLLIKKESMFFIPDVEKKEEFYGNIFFKGMINLLIEKAKKVPGKLKLHVEQVTNEHISKQIDTFNNEFWNLKNISEMIITLDDNKFHDSLIHLIKSNKLNTISICSNSVLSNCDELLKSIIHHITHNNKIEQSIILELVFPENYDTEYLDKIQSLSLKNSKISFYKGIKYKFEENSDESDDVDYNFIRELESIVEIQETNANKEKVNFDDLFKSSIFEEVD